MSHLPHFFVSSTINSRKHIQYFNYFPPFSFERPGGVPQTPVGIHGCLGLEIPSIDLETGGFCHLCWSWSYMAVLVLKFPVLTQNCFFFAIYVGLITKLVFGICDFKGLVPNWYLEFVILRYWYRISVWNL